MHSCHIIEKLKDMIAFVEAAHQNDIARYIFHQADTCYAASLSSPTIGLQAWLEDHRRCGDEMMRHIGSQCRPISEEVISSAASRTVDFNSRTSPHDQPCRLTPLRAPYSSACPRWHIPFLGSTHHTQENELLMRPLCCPSIASGSKHWYVAEDEPITLSDQGKRLSDLITSRYKTEVFTYLMIFVLRCLSHDVLFLTYFLGCQHSHPLSFLVLVQYDNS